MILRKIILGVVALALLAASAATALVAASFAVYALLRDILTPAGAAGAVIGFVAVIAAIAAFTLMSIAKIRLSPSPRRRVVAGGASTVDRVVELARERPYIAAGVGLAAGVLALVNPKVITAVLRAFTDRDARAPRKRRDD